ncbi:MAG TPA: type II toxin-antitoxin system HicB family antitoxin [Caldilineae bacterium]|nr:type II toxin-antitoxin system HicB family antitoxin [Caldilineae bacterium]
MQHDFTVIIERDPESDWLVGSVTELPGCYTQAPTMAELESNMREAIEVYLETIDEDVRQMPWSTFVGLQRVGVSL